MTQGRRKRKVDKRKEKTRKRESEGAETAVLTYSDRSWLDDSVYTTQSSSLSSCNRRCP
jgi:hypothetical protein